MIVEELVKLNNQLAMVPYDRAGAYLRRDVDLCLVCGVLDSTFV